MALAESATLRAAGAWTVTAAVALQISERVATNSVIAWSSRAAVVAAEAPEITAKAMAEMVAARLALLDSTADLKAMNTVAPAGHKARAAPVGKVVTADPIPKGVPVIAVP